jgi:hypothetical protein
VIMLLSETVLVHFIQTGAWILPCSPLPQGFTEMPKSLAYI